MFEPIFRAGNNTPLVMTMECPACLQPSLAAHLVPDPYFEYDFYFRCCNPWCAAARANAKEPVPCVLKLRNYQKENLQFTVGDVLVLDKHGDPDIFDREYGEYAHKPTAVKGPYESCAGHLDWKPGDPQGRDTWVHCKVCMASYHVYVFASCGISTPANPWGALSYHNQFRVRYRDGAPHSILASWGDDQGLKRIPKDWLLCVMEVVWMGDRVTEVEEIV